jgi:hypothetical protein
MAQPSGSVIDEVMGNLRDRQPQSWHYRVSAEHADTLRQIKEAYQAGRFGSKKKPAAEAIARTLNDRGIADVQYQGVLAWLERVS